MRASHFLTIIFVIVVSTPLYAASLVNINTADKAALTTLKGIGDFKAQAIIDYRTANGPFKKIDDIQEVKGIGPATYATIKDFITIETTVPEPAKAPIAAPAAVVPAVKTTAPTPAPKKTVQTKRVTEPEVSEPVVAPAVAARGLVLGAATEQPLPHDSSALWLSLGGLGIVIAAGVAAAYYVRRPLLLPQETLLSADEFDIE